MDATVSFINVSSIALTLSDSLSQEAREEQRKHRSSKPLSSGVADITQLYTREKTEPELLRRVAQLEALPASWRDYFQEQSRRQNLN